MENNIQPMTPDQAAAALAFVTKISQDRNSQANEDFKKLQDSLSPEENEVASTDKTSTNSQ